MGGKGVTNSLPQDYYQRLHEIQAVDFVIVELMLYLDTHPDDTDAIRQYNQYAGYSRKLKAKFESKYGPLTQGSPDQTESYWSWKKVPGRGKFNRGRESGSCGFMRKNCSILLG